MFAFFVNKWRVGLASSGAFRRFLLSIFTYSCLSCLFVCLSIYPNSFKKTKKIVVFSTLLLTYRRWAPLWDQIRLDSSITAPPPPAPPTYLSMYLSIFDNSFSSSSFTIYLTTYLRETRLAGYDTRMDTVGWFTLDEFNYRKGDRVGGWKTGWCVACE